MNQDIPYLRCFNAGQWLAYCEADEAVRRCWREYRAALQRKNAILYDSIKGRPHALGEEWHGLSPRPLEGQPNMTLG